MQSGPPTSYKSGSNSINRGDNPSYPLIFGHLEGVITPFITSKGLTSCDSIAFFWFDSCLLIHAIGRVHNHQMRLHEGLPKKAESIRIASMGRPGISTQKYHTKSTIHVR